MPVRKLDEMPATLSTVLWTLRATRGTIQDFLDVVNRLGKPWGNVLLQDSGFELLLTYMLQGSGLSLDELEEKVNKVIEKGRKEGEYRQAVVFAEKLLAEGMSIEKVAELTELFIEEVGEIAEKRSDEQGRL